MARAKQQVPLDEIKTWLKTKTYPGCEIRNFLQQQTKKIEMTVEFGCNQLYPIALNCRT